MDAKSREARIHAQIVEGIYRQAPAGMVATLINATILAVVLHGVVPTSPLLIWLSAMVLLVVARTAHVAAYRRAAPPPERARAWGKQFVAGLFLAGVLWGSTAVFLFPEDSAPHQALLAIVLSGMAAGAVGSFSPLVEAFALFTLPALTPLIVRFLMIPDGVHRALAAMTFLFIGLTLTAARRTSRANRERVELKEHFADMLEERTSELTQSNARLKAEVEERKQTEKALAASEVRYRELFDNIPDLLYAHDVSGKVLEANRAWERYGFDRSTLLGGSIRGILAEPVQDELEDYLESVLKDGFVEGLMRIQGNDGTEFVVEYRSDLVRDDKGRPVAVRGAGRDVTDRMQADRDKQALEAQLMRAQRLEAIGTLAGGIAHNFNNLLMGVQGNASLGRMEVEPDHPLQVRLEKIEHLVARGSELTGNLLAYAREGTVQVSPLDINHVARSTASTFGETRKDIRVRLDLAGDRALVEADVSQIRQVVMNLCVNAAEAMPNGGELFLGTCRVPAEEIRRTRPEARDCDHVRLSVRDTGVGMDRETLGRVFDPFFTTKEMGKGTGLGLSSVHGIVESHGGLIEVDSEVGRGTRVDVFLPAAEGSGKGEKLMEELVPREARTVLVVDDEEIVLEVGEQMLKALGFRVLSAGSGREALETYERHAREIDLVILDMIMPDMGGGKTFDELKALNPDVRVLLSSGYSLNGEAEEILKRGCCGFIQKPFNLSDLSDTLKNLLA